MTHDVKCRVLDRGFRFTDNEGVERDEPWSVGASLRLSRLVCWPADDQASFDAGVARGNIVLVHDGEFQSFWPAHVAARGVARVHATGGIVEATDDAVVAAYGDCEVFASGRATVVVRESGVVVASQTDDARVLRRGDEGWSMSKWPDVAVPPPGR